MPIQRRSIRRAIGRGFTLIELLVVIAIIAVISGILVVSLGSVIGSKQKDQTVALLKRLDNAMAELTTSPAGAFKMYSIQLPAIYFPEGTNNDFPNSTYRTWHAVPSGALESQVRTALVLDRIIGTNPSAKQFLADLPPERRRKITWTTPLAAGVQTFTMPLDAWGNPILFVFDGLQIPTGTNVGRPFTVSIGATSGNQTYVGGLTNLIVDSDKSYYEPVTALAPPPTVGNGTNTDMPSLTPAYDRATNSKYTAYLSHKGPTGAVEYALRSPDQKPFWVSAGPDGRYDTHDDNVYSFGH